MDTQTQIDRLIELAIIQRSELKQLVEQLPQLREHLNAEVEKVFDETEPQLRAELEEWTTKQTADKTAALGVALEAKITELAKSLEVSTQARYNAIIAEREENARLAAQAEAKIAEHAASLPSAVKDIVSAELARFPRAGEIDQLRKEFAEPRGLNPRGKWQAGESYSKLDFVTINGDSYASNVDNNRTRPSRSSADWTLVAARGTGGGGGPTSLSELTTVPSDGDVLIGSGTSWVTSNLTAGAGISITVGPGAITISATDGDITLDDGTAASPSLHFTNDPDTGIYRPAANTLGISVSGTQVAYFDENGLTVPSAGVVAGGSIHAGNGNANNPSLSFDGDQDTGFFRHQPNEIGIALGGTQYATLTSTTFSITPVVTMASSLRVNGTTESSSKDTGAIVTEGGLGVEKSATIGGNLTVSGADGVTSSGTPWAFLSNNGSLGGYAFYSSGASADQKYWQWQHGSAIGDGTLRLRALNDALSSGTNALVITRTGISSTAVQVGGNLTASGTGTHTFGTTNTVTMTAGVMALTQTGVNSNSTLNLTNDAQTWTIAVLGGTAPSDDSLAIRNGGVNVALFTPSTNATTLAGNLTVSGTGITVSNANPDINGLNITATTGTNAAAMKFVNSGGNYYFGADSSTGGRIQNATGIAYAMVLATELARPLMFFTNNTFGGMFSTTQNFLLGTTIDGGQKLQVSGTAYVSGDATFAGSVSINSSVGATITTSSVARVTLKSTAASGKEWLAQSYTDGSFYITHSGVKDAIRAYPTTGNVDIGGAIAINNTVNTVSPTSPNRTITMVIGGTTYYIHAKTTND